MALASISAAVEKLHRRPGLASIPQASIEAVLPESLKRLARGAITAPHRSQMEVALSLTLGAAATDGIQVTSATITSLGGLIESVPVCDMVTHTALTRRLVYVPREADLIYQLSTSELAGYSLRDDKIAVRQPSGALAQTSNALTVRSVQVYTAVTQVPDGLVDLYLDIVAELVMGQPATQEGNRVEHAN